MNKEMVIKMIDEYLSESNISKEWIEALTFCKKELTKSVLAPMYINHPLCDACRDYGDIVFKDCNKCEVKDEILRRYNMTEKIKVKLDKFAYMPARAHADDAGLDLKCPIFAIVAPRDSAIIDTGVHVTIPKGYVGMLKSKSGLNVNHGITSEGVIDAGYTGSIVCKLYNNSDHPYVIDAGDKITQLVIMPIITPELEYVDELEDTERGSGGFGSSGR